MTATKTAQCPSTGRDAAACERPDHATCPSPAATRFTGTTTTPIFDPRHTNPEDWTALTVTEWVDGQVTDAYVTMRTSA